MKPKLSAAPLGGSRAGGKKFRRSWVATSSSAWPLILAGLPCNHEASRKCLICQSRIHIYRKIVFEDSSQVVLAGKARRKLCNRIHPGCVRIAWALSFTRFWVSRYCKSVEPLARLVASSASEGAPGVPIRALYQKEIVASLLENLSLSACFLAADALAL